ncbi:MAG TPA: PEP/pyruvate-binding domain-containing protein, partial [Candidatus Aminicenantes bacterium]|nr:PEP/pyruvate-binding domain-containing protein [Candidatus Aminicenantes bacterium]
MRQTRYLIAHGVNDLHCMLRMRARPKVLLADSYEEAVAVFDRYRQNMLGILSDVCFPRNGAPDAGAGFALVDRVRQAMPDLPVLILSDEPANEALAAAGGAGFLGKTSPRLPLALRDFILDHFGFGDFVFRLPGGRELGRAANLTEFENLVRHLPGESLEYHARRHHFARWLRARTEFELAEEFGSKQVSDFTDAEALRSYLLEATSRLFRHMQYGAITEFGRSKLDAENAFIRLGGGALGGKGRGIAFINALLARRSCPAEIAGVPIQTPSTFLLGTDVFEEFMERIGPVPSPDGAADDGEIARRFLEVPLPDSLVRDLETLIERVDYPLAVRSSGILEDSQTLPLAGLYRTYMIPNHHPDRGARLAQLLDAIRLVYASVFFRSPREYIRNTGQRGSEEKMAVLLQRVVGRRHGDLFYPMVSGVAQSFNFYPVFHMAPEEGVATVALGLGRMVVEGRRGFRFSPFYPEMNPAFGSPREWLKRSQNSFYAIDLRRGGVRLGEAEDACLEQFPLAQAEADGTLSFVASTYDPVEGAIRDTLDAAGPRVVTFAPLLKYGVIPLAEVVRRMLAEGRRAFGAQVEIEFALDLEPAAASRPVFHLLQIRPMVTGGAEERGEVEEGDPASVWCASDEAMGDGSYAGLCDLVYVDPDRFDAGRSGEIAAEIGALNAELSAAGRHCVLLGFGRFGTRDPWLGIPLEWHQMSMARVVIEADLPGFCVDPSQGSHFFHNLISLRMGYFHVGRGPGRGRIDWDWLRGQPSWRELAHVRLVRFGSSLTAHIDGRTRRGVIRKPGPA